MDDVIFRERTSIIHGDKFTQLTDYVLAKIYIKFRCNDCGYTFDRLPQAHIKGFGCASCSGNAKLTHTQACEALYHIHGDSLKYLSTYQNSATKMKVECMECGYIFDATSNNLISKKSGCPSCAGIIPKTNDEFLADVHDKYGDEFILFDIYKSGERKMKIQHKTCGYTFDMTPRQFLDGAGCAKCYGNLITNDMFVDSVYEIYSNDYECLEEYNGADTKIRILHHVCGNVFEKSPHHFVNLERGCPYCSKGSYGVQKVKDFLTKSDISFTLEKTYPDCKDINVLKFDFYLIDYDVLIEYDGRQHFKSDSWGGETALLDRQRKDAIKDKYTVDNDLPFIRIKYDIAYKLIPQYISNELLKYNITI